MLPLYDALSDETSATVCLAYAEGDRAVSITPNGFPAIEALRQLLLQQGFVLWDRHYDCASTDTAEMDAALSRAIEACDNYAIVVSPQAMGDVVCLEGLLFALSMNKRIVPILLIPVESDHLPEPLQGLAWVDLRSATPPLAQSVPGRQLLQRLRHQADYHRIHTRLLAAALNWERQDRHPSGLLSVQAGQAYQRWLNQAQDQPRQYRPLQLQHNFVAASLRQGCPDALVGSTADRRPAVKSWFQRWLGSDPS